MLLSLFIILGDHSLLSLFVTIGKKCQKLNSWIRLVVASQKNVLVCLELGAQEGYKVQTNLTIFTGKGIRHSRKTCCMPCWINRLCVPSPLLVWHSGWPAGYRSYHTHGIIQPVRLAGSYRCWFVYVREKYCWLVHVNNIHVRGLASPASQPPPAERADGHGLAACERDLLRL